MGEKWGFLLSSSDFYVLSGWFNNLNMYSLCSAHKLWWILVRRKERKNKPRNKCNTSSLFLQIFVLPPSFNPSSGPIYPACTHYHLEYRCFLLPNTFLQYNAFILSQLKIPCFNQKLRTRIYSCSWFRMPFVHR